MKKVKISVIAVLLLITLLITLLSGCYSASSVMKRNPEAEELGFSIVSNQDYVELLENDFRYNKEDCDNTKKAMRYLQWKYLLKISSNQKNAKYSTAYMKQIGKKDLRVEKGKHGFHGNFWYSKKNQLELESLIINNSTSSCEGYPISYLFKDIEIAFLTAEQEEYINSLKCDNVTKWEEIKKISDKIIQWNI